VPGGDTSYVFPDLTDAQSALLCVPVPLIPYFRQFFAEMQSRSVWRTRSDWYQGYQAFAEIEEELMTGCMQQLINEQQRMYRLWDTALNGTQYAVAGDVISPELPAVPPASTSEPNALRAHVGRLMVLAENATNGTTALAGEGITGAAALEDDQTARQLLRRLITGVDGNGDPAPTDNLLMALRGTAVATTDRNLISLIDQVESLLTDIKGKLL
jgi:hypothetical protein